MLRALTAVRPAVVAAKSTARANALRSFASSSRRLAGDHHDHHGPPQLYGPGTKDADAIPSDAEQATGLERYQLLGRMEGVDVFDMKPLDASRLGTLAEPIKVQSFYPERLVGCTGFPADSHDVIWLTLNSTLKNHRCPECGSVYTLDVQGDASAHHH
ncbi:COX5B-domain-containing protein [Schizopora paradoxa]|uniref:Cytochrome c oxidase subunit 4, mitochondrial n=1 Tax=Schizopora paradoxa TaxID=27342 RepID=A0A0H2S0N6_9AGAM|nr:COX5B-domain-containing protein [Schizopora paradoxa]